MKWLRDVRMLLAMVLVVGLVAACGDDGEDDAAGSGSTTTAEAEVPDRGNVDGALKIGHLAPQSGPFSEVAASVMVPVQMAIDEMNAAGGVNGEQVELVTADDAADQTVTATAFDQLVESEKVDAILGPSSSQATLAILDKVRSAGVLECSGSATTAELSDADSGGYFFRTAPPDKFQGPALAGLVLSDERTEPVVIARNDSYGVGLGRSLVEALEEGGASPGDTVEYDPAATTFDSEVQQALDQSPDAVVVLGFNDDGAKIISTLIAKGAGPADMPIYTTDGLQSPRFGAAVDPANPAVVAGIKGTAPAAAPAGIDHPFYGAFMPKGLPPIFSAYYYDCAILTGLAAQAAGSDDPAEMKEAFADNLTGDVDCNTFADCKAALEDGKSIHYRGASASFDGWAGFEPAQGVYEYWSYGPDGQSVTEPPERQVTIR